MENKIVKLDLFGVPCEIDLQDVDFEAFEILKGFEQPKIETMDDIIHFAKQTDKLMQLLIGDKYAEVMNDRKRSVKTYTEIATALKNAMEKMKQ